MSNFFQLLDVFDKSRDDNFKVQTKTGSLISIAFICFSFVVIGTEMFNFLHPKLYRDLNVDPSLTNNQDLINISINVIVDLPCFFLHLDVIDSLGLDQYYVRDTIKFKRLALLKPEENTEVLPSSISSYKFLGIANKTAKDVCFSCYDIAGFLQEGGEACCNSCEQLILLYKRFGKKPEPQNWDQCKAGKYSRDVTFDEKCQVKGKITVNKVPGTFHIAPGINSPYLMKYRRGGHSHNLNFDFPSQGLGMTHQIINIRFGSKKIPKSSNPLSNILNGHPNVEKNRNQKHLLNLKTIGKNKAKANSKNGSSLILNKFIHKAKPHKVPMIYRYDLTSTPAIYVEKTRKGNEIKAVGFDTSMITFQYPRTCTCQNPGIFFSYIFTPYTVVITNDTKESGTIQIISTTLGFLAGAFVVALILDAALATIEEKRKNKPDIPADELAKEQ